MSCERVIGAAVQIGNALGRGILILMTYLLGQRLAVAYKDMLTRASDTEEVALVVISLRNPKMSRFDLFSLLPP
jgi:hypothetical protein